MQPLAELRSGPRDLKPVGDTGLPTQPNDNMSAQEGADLLKLIDYRRRKPEPGAFAYVEGPHVHQGYNNCGASATTMLARFQAAKVGAWEFKRMCRSPVGTGTDWSELMAAAEKIGLHWKLVTFTPDDAGFKAGTAFVRSELDAGAARGDRFPFHGVALTQAARRGHHRSTAGYIAAKDLYILRNPAIARPGLELITAADLQKYWQSDGYSALSHGKMSRPAIVIDGASELAFDEILMRVLILDKLSSEAIGALRASGLDVESPEKISAEVGTGGGGGCAGRAVDEGDGRDDRGGAEIVADRARGRRGRHDRSGGGEPAGNLCRQLPGKEYRRRGRIGDRVDDRGRPADRECDNRATR